MTAMTKNLEITLCHGRVGHALVPRPSSLLPRSRRGFTFTEVMFAVILLGIGFIMLAGMFPVAIQQTQTNVEESKGSTIARSAAHYMEEALTIDDVPPTGNLDLTKTPKGTDKQFIPPQFLRLTERCYRF